MKPDRASSRPVKRRGAKVDGIRLGPDRKRVLSLDAAHMPDVPVIEASAAPTVDWPGFAAAIRLTRFERAVFLRHWRDSVPKFRLHHVLGCPPREVEKAYIAIIAKMQMGTGDQHITFTSRDSLRPAFRDRLPSGARPWALSNMGPEFAKIMLEEKYIWLLSQRDPSFYEKRRVFCPRVMGAPSSMKTIAKLKQDLTSERGLLDRTHEKIHSNFVALTEAEGSLETAQRALRKALKELPSSSAAFQGAVAIGQTETLARRSDLSASKKEAAVQATKIVEIEGELAVREFEATREAFGPLSAEVYAALDALEGVCMRVDTLLEKTGPADLDQILFPVRQEAEYYPMPTLAKRNARERAFFAGLSASRIHVSYDARKELAG
jgi:hypothetical protein